MHNRDGLYLSDTSDGIHKSHLRLITSKLSLLCYPGWPLSLRLQDGRHAMDRDRFATCTKPSTELTHIPSTMNPRYSNNGYGITPKAKKKIQKAKQLVSEENRYHIINSTPLRKNHIARYQGLTLFLLIRLADMSDLALRPSFFASVRQ